MPDPIGDPLPQEDVVHLDEAPPRVGAAPSRKEEQARAYQATVDRENNELSLVLGTEEGQAVIMRILDGCGIYYDGHMTDLQQGRRLVGLSIIKSVAALGPEAYPKLLVGHAQRQQRIRDQATAATSNASKT